jgi:hypothetical protein
MIHVSHTRKDLLDIIDIYEFYKYEPLANYEEMTKQEISFNLWSILCDEDLPIPQDDKYMFFTDIRDIKIYLLKSSPNRQITSSTLLDINEKVKNLIYYCKKCNYEISLSNYDSINDVIKHSTDISIYGNMPNVRRAIKLINKDVKIKEKIELVMSQKVRRTLLHQEKVKKETTPSFKVKRGEYVVVFA